MEVKEIIKVLKAFKKGKDIEVRHNFFVNNWELTKRPIWNFDMFDYRIKPEYEPEEPVIDWDSNPIVELISNRILVKVTGKGDAEWNFAGVVISDGGIYKLGYYTIWAKTSFKLKQD